MKKYFQHDFDARNDDKLQALIADFGALGYAVYFATVERLHEAEGNRIELKAYRIKAIARDLNEDAERVGEVLRQCAEYDLFILEDNTIRSPRVDRNISKMKEISEKRRDAINRRWGNTDEYDDDSNEYERDSNEYNSTHDEYKCNTNEYTCNSNEIQTDTNIKVKVKEKENTKSKEKEKERETSERGASRRLRPEDFPDEAQEFANWFLSTLEPEQQKRLARQKAKWADTFDKLIRIDKRSPEEIYAVTEFARKDERFWKANLLSATALRKTNKDGVTKFDTIKAQMPKNNGAAKDPFAMSL
ncbi:MAG: DUF4373 domain-containing protein [Candidatus Kapaibacterium sp.]